MANFKTTTGKFSAAFEEKDQFIIIFLAELCFGCQLTSILVTFVNILQNKIDA